MMRDATGKEARRAAYATYVECFWSLRCLPPGDARRPALARATQRAEADWRAAMARVPRSAEREQPYPLPSVPPLEALQVGDSSSA